MAGAAIQVRWEDAEVRKSSRDLIARLQDPARAMRDIGEHMLGVTDQRFRTETGPDGTRWQALSDITLMRRIAGTGRMGGADGKPVGYLDQDALGDLAARRGRASKRKTAAGGRTLTKRGMAILAAAKILRDSGALQDTIRYQLVDAGRGVEIGTNRIYGAMQQFGGTRAQWPHLWGDIPARPFLGVSEADARAILEILQRHLRLG